jgi:hypothetical protein
MSSNPFLISSKRRHDVLDTVSGVGFRTAVQKRLNLADSVKTQFVSRHCSKNLESASLLKHLRPVYRKKVAGFDSTADS